MQRRNEMKKNFGDSSLCLSVWYVGFVTKTNPQMALMKS